MKEKFQIALVVLTLTFTMTGPIFAAVVTYNCGKTGCHIQNDIKVIELNSQQTAFMEDYALRIIQSLIQKPIDVLAKFNLSLVKKEIESIRWHILIKGYLAAQGRLSGFMYNVEERTISVELENMMKYTSSRHGQTLLSTIILHESLGALGYFDEDYQISSLLSALDQLTPIEIQNCREQLQKLDLNLTRRSRSPSGPVRPTTDQNTQEILAAGGSTTVGGGGDPLIAVLKTQMLVSALKKLEPLPLLQQILSVRLERPVTYTERSRSGLVEIQKYPLNFTEFLKSISLSRIDDRFSILIHITESSPVTKIEEHLVQLLKQHLYPNSGNKNENQ